MKRTTRNRRTWALIVGMSIGATLLQISCLGTPVESGLFPINLL
jgi:hypothetical protein